MSYVSAASVVFSASPHEVFSALCDLSRYPEWNSGMVSITHDGQMREGLCYRTASKIAGSINHSEIVVSRFHNDRMIELASDTGAIRYRALFNLIELSCTQTELICTLRFEFHNREIKASRHVVEASARARIEHDLVSLRSMMVCDCQTRRDTSANRNSPRR